MSKRPNFILFVTDQHRADYLGCYGHPVLQTPNIDDIAARGVAFDSFYVASPVCMPNHASMMIWTTRPIRSKSPSSGLARTPRCRRRSMATIMWNW